MTKKIILKNLASFIGLLLLILLTIWFGALTAADRSLLTQKAFVFESTGGPRTYRFYVPQSVNKDTKLVFAFDGFVGSGRRIAYYSGLHNVAHDSIVVYPDPIAPNFGQISGWNASFCCGSGWAQSVDDVGFINDLAKKISENYNLKTDSFYAVGFSNGAFLAQRIASELPEKVRAIVSVSGTIGTVKQSFSPKVPVPILLIHGKTDEVVPIEGGARPSEPDFVWLSHAETEKTWRVVNRNAALTEALIHNNGHEWPGWRIVNFWETTPEASIRVLKFFEKASE